jgi:hypothetical protein
MIELALLSVVRDTPTFGVPPDMPQRLKARGKPLVLVWGRDSHSSTSQLNLSRVYHAHPEQSQTPPDTP